MEDICAAACKCKSAPKKVVRNINFRLNADQPSMGIGDKDVIRNGGHVLHVVTRIDTGTFTAT